MNQRELRTLVKELVPPIVFRLSSSIRPRRADSGRLSAGREQDPAFYDQSFREHEHWRAHYTQSSYYPLWTIIADRIIRAGVTSILDIGCGPGQLALLLRDKGLPDYLGIDFSPERVEQAKKACPEFNFVLADIFETDLLETQRYDAVLCTEFLEHIERDRAVLHRVREGVRFYGTVPNFPAPAHVRSFDSAHEVLERYGEEFQDFMVDTHLANTNGIKYFLMEGIKR